MSIEYNKTNNTRRRHKYLLVLFLMLILVNILDNYNTNFLNTFPSAIRAEFLSDKPQEIGQSIYQLCVGLASFGMYFVFINQTLADKFGRKALLILVTFGMSISCLLLFFSADITTFTIYLFLVYIFFSSDMWLIYVNEESPPEKRAYYTNLVVASGVIGAMLIPVCRSFFFTEDSTYWRGMTFFPIIAGIIVGILVIIFVKESSKYEEIKKKGKELKTTPGKRRIMDIFKSPNKKEFQIVLLMSVFNGLNYGFITLGEDYIKTYSDISVGLINILIYIIALSVVAGYLTTGIFSDKIGRKPMLYFHSILQPSALIMTIIGVNLDNFVIVALGFALSYAAFWSLMMVLRIIAAEILPTD
ncbi:MAG: MFS transporter, partial [Promethearchaeota archaeon]